MKMIPGKGNEAVPGSEIGLAVDVEALFAVRMADGCREFGIRCEQPGGGTGNASPREYVVVAALLREAIAGMLRMRISREALMQGLWDAGEVLTEIAEGLDAAAETSVMVPVMGDPKSGEKWEPAALEDIPPSGADGWDFRGGRC